MSARGWTVEVDLGADEARGAMGMTTARVRVYGRGSTTREESVSHLSRPLQGRFELGLAKVGHRRRGMARRGLVGTEFRGGE